MRHFTGGWLAATWSPPSGMPAMRLIAAHQISVTILVGTDEMEERAIVPNRHDRFTPNSPSPQMSRALTDRPTSNCSWFEAGC